MSLKIALNTKFESFKLYKYFKEINFNNITSLCMFLGTKLGVGVFISVSISILLGGPSTVLWMLIFMLITSPIIYEEAYLGFVKRKKFKDFYVSGPQVYIKNKKISILFLILFLITYTLIFMMIQVSTLYNIIDLNINVNKCVIFIIFFVILTYLLIFNNKEILDVLNKLVISMCVIIFLLFLFVIVRNVDKLFLLLNFIIDDINNKMSIFTAFIASFILSVKRNVFQTELLLGTTSIGSASSSNIKNAISNNMLGHYFLMIIIFFTGIIVIIYQINNQYDNNYFVFITNVFKYHFGNVGVIIIIVLFSLLALTTLISAFYFGISYISFYGSKITNIYKIIMLIFSLCGIFISEGIIWLMVDFMSLLLMTINGIALWRNSYDRK